MKNIIVTMYHCDQREFGYSIASGGEGVTGYRHSESIRQDISEKMMGNQNHVGRVIYQFSLSGEYIAEYISVSEASRMTGTPRTGISDSINPSRRPRYSAGGFIWISSDEYSEELLMEYVEKVRLHMEKTNRAKNIY